MPRRSPEGETYHKPSFSRPREGQLLDNSPLLLLVAPFPDLSIFEQLVSPDSTKFVGDVRWVDVPGLSGMMLRVDNKLVRVTEFGVQSLHGVSSYVAKHYESRVEGFCTLQGKGIMEKSGKAVQSRCGEEWTETLVGTMSDEQLVGSYLCVLSDGSIRVSSDGQVAGQAVRQIGRQEQFIRPVVTMPGQSHGTRTTSETLLGLNWIGEVVRLHMSS